MNPYFAGTLVLQARRRVTDFEIPLFRNSYTTRGQHVPGQYNGHWSVHTSIPDAAKAYLPQRYKNLHIISSDPEVLRETQAGLETLDSQYQGAKQLFKLGKLLDRLPPNPHATLVNIEATSVDDEVRPGSFYLLSNALPIYMALVFDQDAAHESVQLVFATFDMVPEIRLTATHPNRYVFFRFPPIVSHPMFISPQYLCKRWYSVVRSLKEKPLGLLTACNALENQLYKDPKVPY